MEYLDFETNFDDALVTLLTDANIPAKKLRSTLTLQTPYVEVSFELGPSLGQKNPITGNDTIFSGNLSFVIVTDRDANGAQHAEIITETRELMLAQWQQLILTEYPFYEVLQISGNGTSYQIVEELDETTLQYNFIFGLVEPLVIPPLSSS